MYLTFVIKKINGFKEDNTPNKKVMSLYQI